MTSSLRMYACAAAVLVLTACSAETFPQSTLHPTSDGGEAIDRLFRQIFWWAMFVFVVVQAALVYTVVRFRANPARGTPRAIHGNTVAEIAWTLAPAVILVFVAVPTIRTIFQVDGRAPEGALQVEVVGKQWWWEFRYPELGVVTANELHLPHGRPVELVMTSTDVIHSFWAPRLMGKRDLMAGRITRIAFTPDSVGTFLGQCAEFCGESHANMRFRVLVQTPEEFAAWVERQTAGAVPVDTTDQLPMAGRAAFTRIRSPSSNSCIACHTIRGVSAGLAGPNLTHFGSRITLGSGMLPNTEENLARWLRDTPAVKPGSLMPRIDDLTEDEIAALVAYLHGKK